MYREGDSSGALSACSWTHRRPEHLPCWTRVGNLSQKALAACAISGHVSIRWQVVFCKWVLWQLADLMGPLLRLKNFGLAETRRRCTIGVRPIVWGAQGSFPTPAALKVLHAADKLGFAAPSAGPLAGAARRGRRVVMPGTHCEHLFDSVRVSSRLLQRRRHQNECRQQRAFGLCRLPGVVQEGPFPIQALDTIVACS